MDLFPTSAFCKPYHGEVDTLLASPAWSKITLESGQALLWTSRDQKGAFYVWRLPAAWRRFLAWGRPVELCNSLPEGCDCSVLARRSEACRERL